MRTLVTLALIVCLAASGIAVLWTPVVSSVKASHRPQARGKTSSADVLALPVPPQVLPPTTLPEEKGERVLSALTDRSAHPSAVLHHEPEVPERGERAPTSDASATQGGAEAPDLPAPEPAPQMKEKPRSNPSDLLKDCDQTRKRRDEPDEQAEMLGELLQVVHPLERSELLIDTLTVLRRRALLSNGAVDAEDPVRENYRLLSRYVFEVSDLPDARRFVLLALGPDALFLEAFGGASHDVAALTRALFPMSVARDEGLPALQEGLSEGAGGFVALAFERRSEELLEALYATLDTHAVSTALTQMIRGRLTSDEFSFELWSRLAPRLDTSKEPPAAIVEAAKRFGGQALLRSFQERGVGDSELARLLFQKIEVAPEELPEDDIIAAADKARAAGVLHVPETLKGIAEARRQAGLSFERIAGKAYDDPAKLQVLVTVANNAEKETKELLPPFQQYFTERGFEQAFTKESADIEVRIHARCLSDSSAGGKYAAVTVQLALEVIDLREARSKGRLDLSHVRDHIAIPASELTAPPSNTALAARGQHKDKTKAIANAVASMATPLLESDVLAQNLRQVLQLPPKEIPR